MRHDWQFLAIDRQGVAAAVSICQRCGLSRTHGVPPIGGTLQLDLSGDCPMREGERARGVAEAVFNPGQR